MARAAPEAEEREVKGVFSKPMRELLFCLASSFGLYRKIETRFLGGWRTKPQASRLMAWSFSL